ncbi:MAG: hypothetical protein IT480_10730 [Gammaproteobacteria bacterium]|nr:hypothetical protein [Gammaproteobacteria bacterium]
MPTKHRVMAADGSLDVEASARKNAEAYGALEKRLGSSDVPPPSAGEYVISAPEALKDQFQPEDPGFKEFLTAAHVTGMTQKQMDAAMGAFFNWAPKLIGASQEIDHDGCVAKLKEVWLDAAANQAGWKNAMRALSAYGGERAQALAGQYGNNPDIVWLLAQVGNEMREDTSPQSSGQVSDDIQALMSSEAYHNPKHADHKRVSEKVSAHFAKKFGTK